MNDLSGIKAGDSVAHFGSYDQTPIIRKVDKITPAGFIVVGHSSFYPNGRQRGGSSWGRCRIAPVTPELEKKAHRRANLEFIRCKQWESFSDEALQAIVATIKEHTP